MKSVPGFKNKKIFRTKEIKERSLPIVAIGASAGGLEAMVKLLRHLPINTGMAFIYVQHLSPDHPSTLPLLLSKSTKMKVREVAHRLKIESDNLYVCTPNKEIIVVGDKIKLIPRRIDRLPYLPIDDFFFSLAKKYKEKVIGIILSGNATDGTLGLKAIREAGGLTFAQDGSAKFRSMPKSAIKAGGVDFVLSPIEMSHELTRLSKNGLMRRGTKGEESSIQGNGLDLKTIFGILHEATHVDFSRYKMATIKRRLDHRMLQRGVKTIKEYATLLSKKPNEVDILYKDLLINVSSFFRDAEIFRYLKTTFFPKLLKSKGPDETLRIWVPACSRGEEAYSIAMLIAELQENELQKRPVQIFATDLSAQAIRDARIGKYPKRDMEPVGKKYVKRFFTKAGDTYHIVKELREMCVFAPHNILSDPPFSRIDFISCRNLLIYFDAAAQKKTLATLHFVLNAEGYLMLGKAETIETSSQLFTPLSNGFKIYSRNKNTGTRKLPEQTPRLSRTVHYKKIIKPVSGKNAPVDSTALDNAIDAILLARYMPACAIINKDMEILQFRGLTSSYLSHPSGKASLNILKMMRPEFAFELRNAIHKAIKTKQSVHQSGIEMKIDTAFRMVSLEVYPLKMEWDEPLFLIIFTMEKPAEKYGENGDGGKNIPVSSRMAQKDRRIKKLTEELNKARVDTHFVLESKEKAFEELQAANEEIVSTNEEFQTLNEELETSKEEIEATNEELIFTNQELKTQNELLAESYNYSQTIIATIHEPMIILDNNLRVKSANASFYKKFRVTPKETEGMPLFELGNEQWNIPKLREALQAILSKNSHFENFEVTHIFPEMGEKKMLLNAKRIIQKMHREKLILLAIEDITERAIREGKEKEYLKKDIRVHEKDKLELENAVSRRTRQLEQKNIELESANNELTAFTYVSSHDLQEPLRKIQNFVDCLIDEEKENLSEEGRNYLQRTYETAKRMRSLIDDLLKYSRTKNADGKFEITDLNVILDEVRNDLKETILEKKAKIEIAKICKANIIRFQFRQLMYNLISNSLKFSKPRTAPHIIIKTKIVHGSKLNDEKLSPKIDYCHITYTDNGIGFDPQYKDRIFEVFQRLHSQDEFKGTGIGLAICKRIVENHNGVITAIGKLGKGARFDIYIAV